MADLIFSWHKYIKSYNPLNANCTPRARKTFAFIKSKMSRRTPGNPASKEHNKSHHKGEGGEGGQWSIWKSLLQTWWRCRFWIKSGSTHKAVKTKSRYLTAHVSKHIVQQIQFTSFKCQIWGATALPRGQHICTQYIKQKVNFID